MIKNVNFAFPCVLRAGTRHASTHGSGTHAHNNPEKTATATTMRKSLMANFFRGATLDQNQVYSNLITMKFLS